jgi:hypothetical protein
MAPQERIKATRKKMVDITNGNGKKVEICPSVKIAREEQQPCGPTKHANTITPFYPMKSPGRRRGLSTPAPPARDTLHLEICPPYSIPQL